jgi:hypothetical protein
MMSLWRRKDHSESGGLTAGDLGHSQFGTPLDQILSTDADYDVHKWIGIPTNWADTGGSLGMPNDWAARMGPVRWSGWVKRTPGAQQPEPEVVERTVLELLQYAKRFGGFDPKQPFEIDTYLYCPDPRQYAMPVHLWVDDRPGLTVEQATADEDAIDPPVSEEFVTEALGTGLKSTSHGVLDPQPDDLSGTQGVWVTVRYAFAVPGRQAVVIVKATETDPARMQAAAADLDEFVCTITVTRNDGTPYDIKSGA